MSHGPIQNNFLYWIGKGPVRTSTLLFGLKTSVPGHIWELATPRWLSKQYVLHPRGALSSGSTFTCISSLCPWNSLTRVRQYCPPILTNGPLHQLLRLRPLESSLTFLFLSYPSPHPSSKSLHSTFRIKSTVQPPSTTSPSPFESKPPLLLPSPVVL